MVSASSASVEDIYAFPGQHIELKATTSGSGSYIYEWSVPLGAPQLLEGSGAAANNGPILRFDAPSTLGTYTINVQVSESSATGCVDMVVCRNCCNFVDALYPTTITPRPSINTYYRLSTPH
jgi:hypothetical protein